MSADLRDSLVFLSQATGAIGSSVDPEEAGARLREAVVPILADRAAVYLAGHLVSAEETRPDVPQPYRRRTGDPSGDLGSFYEVLLPAELVVCSPCDNPLTKALVTGRPVVEESLLAVPLRVRDQSLGLVVLLRYPGGSPFTDLDLLVATQLTEAAALAMHHTDLHRRHRVAVETLVRGLHPSSPPRLSGVEIAYRYQPGSETARVGGDWFDVIPLPGGRVALVVGDVMGHGLSAAVIMGQLRTSVQTLASLDMPPEEVLRSLDETAQRLAAQSMTTCVYCVYDPVLRRCTIANAGHMRPILVHEDGRTELISTPPGLPIGLGRPPFETIEIAADDDCQLVLYTDGLVEARGQDIDTGVETVCRKLTAGQAGRLEDLCDDLMPEQRTDDVTLLMVRFRGIASGNVANWYLEPQARTPSRVRRMVGRALAEWKLDELIPSAALLASELVTNAVRFASKPIGIRLIRTDVLLCEVTDDDHRLPQVKSPMPTDEDGRGLRLVSELAERWGANRVVGGKVVWFSLGIPEDRF
ncbi:ATP-binding SpoIIE family protein phosphatase [Rhizohabitans arisaemae]|uniref:ATP-binding SpoIIE family protein phosphatase n=1 Tax=Rhizohabitans arisaemae TaxID=2720610 RepID=UPI0024B082F8|nr:SpoIIE family protein phosphatase [Rhizohabitans arisaemae]